MKIGWNIQTNSSLASYRYRTNIPINILKNLGYDVGLGTGNVTIFQKHFNLNDINVAKNLKSNGKKVIFDLCDNHFGKEFEKFYVEMCKIADIVTCSTIGLKEVIKKYTNRDAIIILDSYEFDEEKADIPSRKVNNILWYGSSTNIEPLTKTPITFGNLRIVSDVIIVPKTSENVICSSNSVKWYNNGASIEFIKWKHEDMPNHFKWCDIVIIPVFNNLKYYVKGGNRMFEAVRQGRFVVANYMPAYTEYEMWVGNIYEGIDWVNKNIEEAIIRIKKAQEIIKVKHDPEKLAKIWIQIANKLLGE